MDMGMGMDVATATVTAVSSIASVTRTVTPASTALAPGMVMSMSMGGGNDCKVSMLLNWNTIDACFLTSFLKIKSSFTFFLACLAAFLLVLSLEFLRRLQRKFDRYLLSRSTLSKDEEYAISTDMEEKLLDKDEVLPLPGKRPLAVVVEQLARGVLHVSQFAVSYCVMLLYMSSNGYIIISILCGALVGFALFTRDTLRPSVSMGVNIKKDCC